MQILLIKGGKLILTCEIYWKYRRLQSKSNANKYDQCHSDSSLGIQEKQR